MISFSTPLNPIGRWPWPLAALIVLTLAACGGGGTGSPDTADAGTLAQPLGARLARPDAGATTNVYYIDSTIGNDSFDGSSQAVGPNNVGPWRSLARLARATLNPGDTVRLACGSVWNETLKLASSGTAASPITVNAYPSSSCKSLPVIDGSTSIGSAAWTLHKGSIYKATLASAPLLLSASTGALTWAHHPNRGFDGTQPSSLYLRNAVDSDSSMVNGTPRSTYLTTGADLKLPTGATLTAGTTLRVRNNAWVIDETTIASIAGTRLNLSTPTSSPVAAGWGYFLLGQLWMLDSPGEYHYDSAAKTLYLWMPNSARPTVPVYAAQLATGIDAGARSYVTFDGLAVRFVGTALSMRNSTGITLRNANLQDVSGVGVDAAGSSAGRLEANVITRTGGNAISGANATGLQVVNNTITSAGVLMSGDTVVSLPAGSNGAIVAGLKSTVTGNAVSDAGYDGIVPMAGSTVSGNYVYGACSVLDDGAGIYTSGPNNNSIISGNVVVHSRGAIDGKPTTQAFTQAQGIYLDEHASGVTVTGNSVTDADHGIQLHISNNNNILNNKLYGNRKSQLWLQETDNEVQAGGDVYGNVVAGNQVAPMSSSARGLYLQSLITDTYHFAQFDRNVYLDRIYARMSTEEAPGSLVDYSFPNWQLAKLPNGTARALDPNGKAASAAQYAPALVAGSNIVPNGNLLVDATGWTAWNQTSPFGVLTRQACTPGYCANYVAGASQGLVSTPNFSVVKDQWYRVSFDVQAGADNQAISALVRRGGGGSNGYEPLSNVYYNGTASRGWKRISFTLQANATVNAGDPVTLDKGARLDFEHVLTGQTLVVTNVEIVPITSATAATNTAMLLNTSSGPNLAACPLANTQPTQCSLFVRLSDSAPIVWPYTLTARSSEIVYTLDPSLLDSDGDGIADSQDLCPGTAKGLAVNAKGCSIGL